MDAKCAALMDDADRTRAAFIGSAFLARLAEIETALKAIADQD